jgi:hypothetical protein
MARGRKDCAVKFGQSNLEKILQVTAALFSFLQIYLFSGSPPNMTYMYIFAVNGCG